MCFLVVGQVIPDVLKDHSTFIFRVKEYKKSCAILEDQPIEQLIARLFFLDCSVSENERSAIRQNIQSPAVLNNLILPNRVCWVFWLHGQRS